MAKTRKEIDKELMFNKIMPSARMAPQPEAEARTESAQTEETPVLSTGTMQNTPQEVALPRAMAIGVKRSVIDTDKEVRLKETEPACLVNLMERMVAEKLDAAFDKFHCCKCDKCKKDAAAIALNKLPPRYVVAEKLSLLLEDRQTNTEVTTAIIQGILIVKAHPRH